MPAYCEPCGRTFKGQGDLDKHMRYSLAHAKNLLQMKLPPVKFKQQDRVEKLPWSVIVESEYGAVIDTLSAHCHPLSELKENGYIVHLYSPLDYANAWKCKRCNSHQKKTSRQECTFHPSRRNKFDQRRPYKCCTTKGKGCRTLPAHDFHPPLRAFKHKDYLETPTASAKTPKFRAVALDCEMAGVASGAGEAILLCVTDYVTGAVLMNRFVWPTERITQMRSPIHGISKSTLEAAVLQGQALHGWKQARLELWKYIDSSTILVGHALEHDLDALRIIHPLIVDSGILSINAVGIRRTQWGLKTLCAELLNFQIRKNEGGIHDCLEDVLATREVVLFCTRNKEALWSWAETKIEKEMRLQSEREMAKLEKENERVWKEMAEAKAEINSPSCSGLDNEDDEILHWADVAEDMGWPHPDTGYDPWLD